MKIDPKIKALNPKTKTKEEEQNKREIFIDKFGNVYYEKLQEILGIIVLMELVELYYYSYINKTLTHQDKYILNEISFKEYLNETDTKKVKEIDLQNYWDLTAACLTPLEKINQKQK